MVTKPFPNFVTTFLYSPECVEEEFSEVRLHDPAYIARESREKGVCGPPRRVGKVYI